MPQVMSNPLKNQAAAAAHLPLQEVGADNGAERFERHLSQNPSHTKSQRTLLTEPHHILVEDNKVVESEQDF